MQKRERIWELDALRGVCILCVIVVHFLFDLVSFAGVEVSFPPVYVFIQQYGGVIFVVLSGCCVTLGSRSFRRGVIVFGCGMLITAVTAGMYWLGMASKGMIVRFGVLHLLGICMMLYSLYREMPTASLAFLGTAFVMMGYSITDVTVQTHLLFPLGLCYPGFSSGDYFPLLPHLGWYMLGTFIGRTLYCRKRTLLPGKAQNWALTRFFCACGRQSLWIYLAHQPIVYGLIQLVLLIGR